MGSKKYKPGRYCGDVDVTVKMRRRMIFNITEEMTVEEIDQAILENSDIIEEITDEEVYSTESVDGFDPLESMDE